MKKMLRIVMVMVLLLLAVAVSASAEQVTSVGTGFVNVPFSNGYYGFCLDRDLEGAYPGDCFSPADKSSAATSNTTQEDISQSRPNQ